VFPQNCHKEVVLFSAQCPEKEHAPGDNTTINEICLNISLTENFRHFIKPSKASSRILTTATTARWDNLKVFPRTYINYF
jgi:hypothetical protein